VVVNAAERDQLALIVADRNQPRKYVALSGNSGNGVS